MLTIPGHHETITVPTVNSEVKPEVINHFVKACPKHAELSDNGDFFKIYRLNKEHSGNGIIRNQEYTGIYYILYNLHIL